jgi:phage host-nuclease inhibitor protein Gam
MAPRSKPQPLIIADMLQADEALRQLGEIHREQRLIEDGAQEQIDQLKAAAKAQLEPLAANRKRLEDALAVFATQNKAEHFGDVRNRSQALVFGTIGFRRTTSLRLKAKRTWAMVLQRLHDLGFKEGIRTKAEVDKDALRGWPEGKLEDVGVIRETTDEFFLELNLEEVAGKAA